MSPASSQTGARRPEPRGPLERLLEATRGLGRPLAREALLETIVAGLTQLHAQAFCTLRLVEAETGEFKLSTTATAAGPAPDLAALDEELAALVLRQARPLLIPDVRLDGDPRRRALWSERGYALYYGVPLPGPAGPLGVLGLALPAGAPAPPPEERRGIDLYAGQAALALRNLELTTTVERQHQTLEVARGELVEAAKFLALGHLVSDVVHEMSNLLGTVTLRMETLLDGSGDPQTEGQLQLLQSHCRQIGDLIGELRRFAGAGGWPRAPLDLGTSVERILRLRQGRLQGRGVKVIWHRGGGSAEVLADRPSLLRALLAILLESETALAAASGGTLTLRMANVEADAARWVRLEVEDDGPPIAPHLLPQLFDPFAVRGPGRGPSVGLAAAHAIIRAHDGRLSVENRAPGVVFRVDLPAS